LELLSWFSRATSFRESLGASAFFPIQSGVAQSSEHDCEHFSVEGGDGLAASPAFVSWQPFPAIEAGAERARENCETLALEADARRAT
jgi:hypothetical protein